MQSGQLQNLQRLERQYHQALSQNGFESPIVIQSAIDFAITLVKDGTVFLKEGNSAQAEIYLLKAKEITTPITIHSGIFYSVQFLKTRGNAILRLIQLYENQKSYMKAWTTIRDVLPFFEKFHQNKRSNLLEEEEQVIKLYITLLHHASENCRMIKRKDEMLEACNKIVELMIKLGMTYEYLKKISKEEFEISFQKWYSILSRAFYQIGKAQYKVGFEKIALKSLYKSLQMSELVFGPDDIKTVKCKEKYEKLSQKLQFEMIMGNEQLDFEKFKRELNQESLPDQFKQFKLKPNKDFNQHILQQVKSYQQIVSQLSSHSSKYQMPEYVKKVREEYEQKLRGLSDSKQTVDTQFTKYRIKRKPATNQLSRATSSHQDMMFSPRTSIAAQSHRVSIYQNLMYDKMDQLKDHLKDIQLKVSVNDLLINRPQIRSEYQQKQKTKIVSEAPKKPQNPTKIKSQRIISKPILRQPTQVFKTESQQSDPRLRHGQTIQMDVIEDERLDTQNSHPQQSQQQLQSQTPIHLPLQIFQNVKTEFSELTDSLIGEYKSRHSITILNKAARKIQQFFRRQKQKNRNNTEPIQYKTGISIGSDPMDSNKNSMKMSIKETMKTSLKRNKGFGIGSIIKDFKTNESEQSNTKAKILVEILIDFSKLTPQKMHFVAQLFFDVTPTFWTISNMFIRAYSPFQGKSSVSEDQNDFISEELRMQINRVHNMFSNQLSMKSISFMVFLTISNCNQKYTIHFRIQNFISYLDEYQRWFFKDQFQMLDSLLSIYIKQQNLCPKKECEKLIVLENENFELGEQLIAKLLYLLQNHYFLIHKEVGYKLVSEKEMQEREYQDECIQLSTIQRNYKINIENQRLVRRLILRQERIRIYEMPQFNLSMNQSEGAMNSIQILEHQDESYQVRDPELLLSYKQNSSINDCYNIIQSQQQFAYDPVKNESQEQIAASPGRNLILRRKHRQSTTIQGFNNLQQKPFMMPSSTLINSSSFSPRPKQYGNSNFQNYQVDQGVKQLNSIIINEESQSISAINNSDLQYLKTYFPEFEIGTEQKVQDYEIGEVIDQFFIPKVQWDMEYFEQQGEIIMPEQVQFEVEYPSKYIMLTYLMKTNNKIEKFNLEVQEQILQIVNENKCQQLDSLILEVRFPNAKQKEQLLNQLYSQNIQIQENGSDNILQLFMQQQQERYITILLNRWLPRINHYQQKIINEIYSPLLTQSIVDNHFPDMLLQTDNQIKLKYPEEESLNNSFIGIEPLSLSQEEQVGIIQQDLASSFANYRTPFNLAKNKFIYALVEQAGHVCVKLELIFKEKKQRDTRLIYLSDQQAKQEQLLLKKELKKLIQKEEVVAKMKIFYPNAQTFEYRSLHLQADVEKVTHLMTFLGKPIFQFLFNATTQKERTLIGDQLSIQAKPYFKEQRDQDKYSELDQFLLLYLQDPMTFSTQNDEQQSRLKQTLMFYFFKQQLKLTLISSSYQRFFMKTYFHQKVFYAQSRVSNIGKVFVELRVYQFNKFYMVQESMSHTYFYFQIMPQKIRTKVFKLILDLADINSLFFSKVDKNNCFNDRVLHEIIKKLTSFLVCYRTNTYNSIKIPLSYISPMSNYDLLNSFREVTFGSNILVGPPRQDTNVRRSNHSQPKLSLIITGTDDKRLYERKHSKSSAKEFNKMFQIDSLSLPEEASRILKNTSMLTPLYRGQKIIYKTTKVIHQMYIIITVSYLPSMGSFQIGCYIPQTCRNFSTFLHKQDFQSMDYQFLESIFPSVLATKDLIDQFFVNRWKFQEINKIYNMALNHPEDFEDYFNEAKSQVQAIPQQEYQKLTESKLSIKEEEEDLFQDKLMMNNFDESKINSSDSQSRYNLRSSTQPPVFLKKQFTKQMSIQSLAVRKSVQLQVPTNKYQHQTESKSQFYKFSPRPSQNSLDVSSYISEKDLFYNTLLVRKNNLDIIASFEIKIWEQLVNHINISKNKQDRFILNLDKYQGILKENLFAQTVYLGNESNVYYEVFIENKQKSRDMFKPFVPLRLTESTRYAMYQRITFFEDSKVVNIKMMLRKPLYQYHIDEKLNLQNHQLRDNPLETYEFILSDLQQCAVYMLNRLKKNFMQTGLCQVSDVEGDPICPQIVKINVNYQHQKMMMQKNYQYTLLVRRVFTLKQTISIFYREKRKRFYIFIWDTRNSRQFTLKYQLNQIQSSIPGTLSLLKLNLHQELGNRIYHGFKNQFLVNLYQQFIQQ